MTVSTAVDMSQSVADSDLLELWTVKVSDLKNLSNPMADDVWGCGRIYTHEVLACEDLSKASLPAGSRKDSEGITWAQDIFSRDYNIARIAWLAYHGWDDTKDPISLDVYPAAMSDWPAIVDGNHRFSAAIVLGMKTIRINPSGDIDFLMETLKPSKIEYV